MKKSLSLVAFLALAIAEGSASAYNFDWGVSGSYGSTSSVAGAMGSAYNSSDSVQYIGCEVSWQSSGNEVDPILRTTEAGGYGGACVSRSLCLIHRTKRRSLLRHDMRAVIQGDPALDAKRRRGEREGGDWQVGDEAVGGGAHGHAAFFACPS